MILLNGIPLAGAEAVLLHERICALVTGIVDFSQEVRA
tara:strand:+ start:6009 stop:6122 length:114 start_codon:yes stop_codon:yes gene_type:complete